MSEQPTASVPSPAGTAMQSSAVAPPPAPRQLTPLAARRAWSEPRVRFWLLAGIVLAIATLYLGVMQARNWMQVRDLVEHGIAVKATVKSADGDSRTGRSVPPDMSCKLQYQVKGQTYNVEGYLQGRTEHIIVGSEVDIRVQEADPTTWTALQSPPSLGHELIGPTMLLPVTLIALAVALLQRARMLKLWRGGEAVLAIVVETRQTALAPSGRAVRCTPKDQRHCPIIQVYVPRAAADVRRGDVLWLITPPGKTNGAVAAAWFAQ